MMDDKARLYLRDIVSEWRNVLKTPANIHLISTQLSVLCAMVEDAAIAERDALRAALQSLLEGQDERDIEHYTRLTVDEARRIMDLAYNRK